MKGSDVFETIEIQNIPFGVMVNDTLQPIFADSRGTVLSAEGRSVLPKPFGDKTEHLEYTSLVDYAGMPFDEDLGVVRMGVRYYDPKDKVFITPDPLFFEDMSKCLGSPIECNLYSYGRNNPLKYTDPTGMEAGDVWLFRSNSWIAPVTIASVLHGSVTNENRGKGYTHATLELSDGSHFTSNPKPGTEIQSFGHMKEYYLFGAERIVDVYRHADRKNFDVGNAKAYAAGQISSKLNYYILNGVCSTATAGGLNAGGLKLDFAFGLRMPNDLANDSHLSKVGTYDGQKKMSIGEASHSDFSQFASGYDAHSSNIRTDNR